MISTNESHELTVIMTRTGSQRNMNAKKESNKAHNHVKLETYSNLMHQASTG